MAFTKSPEYSTHQEEVIPVGGSTKTYPIVGDAGVDFILQNCVLHKFDDGVGAVPIPPLKEDTAAKTGFDAHYGTGVHLPRSAYASELVAYASVTSSVGDPLVVVIDNDLWSYLPGSALTLVTANQYTASQGSIGWTDYAVGSTKYIVSNEALTSTAPTNAIRYYDTALTLSTTTTVDFGDSSLPDIVFLDGYLFALGGLTGQRIYNSTLGAPTTWNTSTDFIDAESTGDPLVGMMRHHNHLVVWGTNSMEFFYNSGNEVGSPLQRQANYAQSIGSFYEENSFPVKCAVGDDIYFMGGKGGNYMGVYKLSNFRVEKISPDWLDSFIARGVSADPFVGRAQFSGTIRPFRFGSKTGILVTAGTASDALDEMYFYDTATGVWSSVTWLLDNRQAFIANTPYGSIVLPFNATAGNSAFPIAYVCTDDFYHDLGEAEGDEGLGEQITATWKTSPLAMKSFNDKHFYSVEVLGTFPYGSVSLFVEEDSLHTGTINRLYLGTKQQTKKTYHQNPMIWRNIGRFKAPRFSIQVDSKNSFRLGGIAVKYNQGTR